MSIPTGDKHGEHDQRERALSDLRALVDMLENEPSLPVPISFTCSAYVPRSLSDDLGSVTGVFAAAEKLGTAVTCDLREGRVETAWQRGSVWYSVYTRLPKPEPDKTRDVVTLASPADILRTTALIARPDLDEQAGEPA